MNSNSPKKKLIFGMDWIDLVLGLIFIALIAALAQLFYAPYGWIAGALIAALLLYLAWRRRMGRGKPGGDNNPPVEPPPTDDLN